MKSDYIYIVDNSSSPRDTKHKHKHRKPTPTTETTSDRKDSELLSSRDTIKEQISAEAADGAASGNGDLSSNGAKRGSELASVVSSGTRVDVASGSGAAADIDYGGSLDKSSGVDEVREWLVRQQLSLRDKVSRGFG
jgi:hypothetical protein